MTFGDLTRDEVLARRDRAKSNLDVFVAASDADPAPLLHSGLQAPIAEYEHLKMRGGRLDFLDLLIKARDLVRDNAAVRNEPQGRYTHFFIDEFQDTDPLQAEILLLPAADDPAVTDGRTAHPVPSKLFLVGEPKQSICRFRRADIALYEEVKARLVASGAVVLHPTTSFRAPPSLQSFVNAAFSPAVTARPDRGQAGYVALEKSRPEIDGRPTLVALPVPRPTAIPAGSPNTGSMSPTPCDAGSLPHCSRACRQTLVSRLRRGHRSSQCARRDRMAR
jgi:ATP-dependent exoDNAse (exonuclease V) beta subunit